MCSLAQFLKNSLRFCFKNKIKTSLDSIDNLGHLIQDFFLILRIKNLLKAFSNSPFLDLNLISKSAKRFEKTFFGSSIRIKIWLTIQFYFDMYRNVNNKNSKKHAFYIFVNLTFSKKHAEILCALFIYTNYGKLCLVNWKAESESLN
jgi:hypothetical protein